MKLRAVAVAAALVAASALGLAGTASAADGDTGTDGVWSWSDGANNNGFDLAYNNAGDNSTYFGITMTYPTLITNEWVVNDVYCVVGGVQTLDSAQTGYVVGPAHAAGSLIGYFTNSTCGTDTIRIDIGSSTSTTSPGVGNHAGPMDIVRASLFVRKSGTPEVPLPACTTAQVLDPAVRYNPDDGQVSQRFKVLIPGFAGVTTVVTTATGGPLTDSIVPPGDAVDGAPGYFYHSHAYTTALSATGAVSTFTDGAGDVCTVTTSPVTAGAVHPDGSTVGASDPTTGGGGADCGLNPFCYIKAALAWAFVPTTSPIDAWSTAESGWAGHFPVSVIVSGAAGVTAFTAILTGGDIGGGGPPGGRSFDIAGGTTTTTINFDPFDNTYTHGDGALPWIGIVRSALMFFFGLGLAWALWNRVSASFGSKASPTGGGT